METFEDRISYGQEGEAIITRWLIDRGNTVIPMYGKSKEDYKGPQIYTPSGDLIAPDLQVISPKNNLYWVECKRKKVLGFYRISNEYTAGIQEKYYNNYIKVLQHIKKDIWILFLVDGGKIKDTDKESPTGLYGNTLSYLMGHINHTYRKPGKEPMVYFGISALKRLASLEDLNKTP